MNVAELKVRKGEPVIDGWKRLVKWVETLKIVPDDRIEIRLSKHGTIVRVRDTATFRHPFRVITSGRDLVQVSTGTCEDLVPEIKTEKDGKRRIDNRDKDGKRVEGKNPPELKLQISKADNEGRIYISIKQKAAPKDKKEKPEPPEIVQTDSAKGPVDGFGYYPLGVIHLTKDRQSIEQTFQVVHHNLRFTFQEKNPTPEELKTNPDAKPLGRFVFFPT